MSLKKQIEADFGVSALESPQMESFVDKCAAAYCGHPYWVDEENHISTVNLAKSVCSEISRLTMLGAGLRVSGGPRAVWLQSEVDRFYYTLREWVEYGCSFGTVILKPDSNGDVSVFVPGSFVVTEAKGGRITGAVFKDVRRDIRREKLYYIRLESHRFLDDGKYEIINRCYLGGSENDFGVAVPISVTPWKDLAECVYIENIDKPLYGVFKTPQANNVDVSSPLGLPVFADALRELRDVDIAYSRNAKEVYDSKRMVLLDSDRLMSGRTKVTAANSAAIVKANGLPDYVKTVEADGYKEIYHEINPSLNTEERLKGINALLSQIGFKCGFSNGYFVFNEKSGMITATQVEADDRRTIQLIKDVRDSLEDCLNGLLYALDKMADLYDLAPVGAYTPVYDFGDIVYNREEDKQTWWKYVQMGKVPFWFYLVKFEGFTEEAAKELEAAAKPKETLFGLEV